MRDGSRDVDRGGGEVRVTKIKIDAEEVIH